jgi:DNA-3-methyladenine glycosylase I
MLIMSDAVVGTDGKPRCPWAGESATPLARYHDEVWGRRTTKESALFEALTLGVFQVGLSWRVVFSKRDAFRVAFHAFDIAKIAKMTESDVNKLLQDPSIIRNRAKIQATIDNARATKSMSPSLANQVSAYEKVRKRSPRSVADVPVSSKDAILLAAQLKSHGYRFIGPTSVYAFMQNVGVVNDHVRGCFLASDYKPEIS